MPFDSAKGDDSMVARETESVASVEGPPLDNGVGSFRFSLRALLGITTCVACLVAAGVELNRRNALRLAEERRLREIAVLRESIPITMQGVAHSLRDYRVVTSNVSGNVQSESQWPPKVPEDGAGQPLYSWRFLIPNSMACGCWDEDEPYQGPVQDLTAPWNSPKNLAFGKLSRIDLSYKGGNTHLFGVCGPDTAFDANSVSNFNELPADAVVLMEVGDSKTHWMQPGDYDVTELLSYTGRIGDHLHGLLSDRLRVLFADGEVWALSPDAPMTALHPFLTIAGAETHDRNQLLAPHRLH